MRVEANTDSKFWLLNSRNNAAVLQNEANLQGFYLDIRCKRSHSLQDSFRFNNKVWRQTFVYKTILSGYNTYTQ
jgi:hypothetical protein